MSDKGNDLTEETKDTGEWDPENPFTTVGHPSSKSEVEDEGFTWGAEGVEKLDKVSQHTVSEGTISISVVGIPQKFTIPQLMLTTNIPLTTADEMLLRDDSFCMGVSSERHQQTKEQLESAVNRVAVFDYENVGRVILINSPAPKESHMPGDAVGHSVMVDAEGNIHFSAVVSDGMSEVQLPNKFVDPKKHTVTERGRGKSKGRSYIEAFASPIYADVAARNAFRIPPHAGNLALLADTLVRHPHRNADYMRAYGGATAQLLRVTVPITRDRMEVESLNLGPTNDLGHMSIISGKKERTVALHGNRQDISFEGLLEGYSVDSLKSTVASEQMPLGVVQMTCDGVKPLPVKLDKKNTLEKLLKSDPKAIVRYLSKSRLIGRGKDRDDETMVIIVPLADSPHIVSETPRVKSLVEDSSADKVVPVGSSQVSSSEKQSKELSPEQEKLLGLLERVINEEKYKAAPHDGTFEEIIVNLSEHLVEPLSALTRVLDLLKTKRKSIGMGNLLRALEGKPLRGARPPAKSKQKKPGPATTTKSKKK